MRRPALDIAERISARMGFAPDDVATVVWLVEQHLLLRDVATRRDIDDPATAQQVANQVGSIDRLRLLAALTEADGLATSATAWDPVDRAPDRPARRTRRASPPWVGGRPAAVAAFPTPDQLARLMDGERRIEVAGDVVTVMTADRPGVFSRVAGVLALHGLDVLAASAYSAQGRALAEFRVTDPFRDETPWPRVTADLELALDGRLALQARLSERVRTYATRRPAARRVPPRRWASTTRRRRTRRSSTSRRRTASASSTGSRRRSPSSTSTSAPPGSRRSASACMTRSTCAIAGGKITDTRTLAEIERAILHGLAE